MGFTYGLNCDHCKIYLHISWKGYSCYDSAEVDHPALLSFMFEHKDHPLRFSVDDRRDTWGYDVYPCDVEVSELIRDDWEECLDDYYRSRFWVYRFVDGAKDKIEKWYWKVKIFISGARIRISK